MESQQGPSQSRQKVFLHLENQRLGKLMTDLWFHQMEELPNSKVDATRKHRTLYYMCLNDFKKVHNQHKKSIFSLHYKEAESRVTEFLSARYLITAENSAMGTVLTLYDLYHGEKKHVFDDIYCSLIHTFGFIKESGHNFTAPRCYLIDAGRILITIADKSSFWIYLLAVNFDTFKLSILNLKVIKGGSQKLFLETTNRRTFVIYNEHNKTLQLGRVHFIKLEVDDYPIDVNFGAPISYFWFADNKLTGVTHKSPSFYEVQVDFESSAVRPEKLFEVIVKDNIDTSTEWNHIYYLPNALCYYMIKQKQDNKWNFLCHLDIRTHELREIGCFTFQHILALHVDEDEVLSVCAKEHSGINKVFRMPLRRPEKLATLAMLETKRQLFFNYSGFLSTQVFQHLPAKLMPFCLDF